MGLDKYLLLGKGIRLKREVPRSLIANAVEAVIAAVYLDRGMEAARHFVLDHLHYYVEEVLADEHVEKNYKSLLQQAAQRELSGTPTYRVVAERGPDHSKSFRVAAVIKGHEYPIGSGDSKKAAEQEAARIAIAAIEKGKGRPRRGSRRKASRNGSDGKAQSAAEPSGGRDRSEPSKRPRSRSDSRTEDRSRSRSKPESKPRTEPKKESRSRAEPASEKPPARKKAKPKARVTGSKKAAKKPAKEAAKAAPAKGKPSRVGRNPKAARKPSRSPRPSSREKGSGRRRGSSRSGNR
jgi:hypothetical protein